MNDNTKGAAISAGATLRRYGEQALREVRSSLFIYRARYLHPVSRISGICWESGPKRLTNVNECGSGRAFQIGAYSSIMKKPSWPKAMRGYGPSRSQLAAR